MLRWTSVFLFSFCAAAIAAPVLDRNASTPVSTITREQLDKLPIGRRLEDLVRTCPLRTLPTVVRPIVDGISTGPSLNCVQPDDLRMIEIYKAHNGARALYGSGPIAWDPELARGAADYARQMTTRGRIHAPREGRTHIRENLLQSLRGGRSPTEMVKVWVDEKRYFKPGVFPDVSTTGDWAKVGHYTQMIWPTTVQLGCAIHSDARHDWTVCRYSPPGNRDGIALGPGLLFPNQKLADRLCAGPNGPMMCPDPEQTGEGQKEEPKQGAGNDQPGQAGQAGQAPAGGKTVARDPEKPAVAPPDKALGGSREDCNPGVIAKVLIPTGRKTPDGKPIYKETHNLENGFLEVVIPFGFEAKGEFKPSAAETFPYDGTMRATWGIVGDPNPYTGTVTGNRAKLDLGKWDDTDGNVTINPGPNRPVVQQHEINAHWKSPTHNVECTFDRPFRFTVTFAAAIPEPAGLDTKAFVEGADREQFPGTRPRPRPDFAYGTRAFHTAPPEPRSRNNFVIVPIGTYWDLPEQCCNIEKAEREVIQFARAAIEGPNGRQAKGWGLDTLPNQKADKFDPVYTGHPNNHDNDGKKLGAGSAGGTKTNDAGDVLQWDAPGMPKDLFDRLHAAQGASIYRQQFLSLLVCRPPDGESRIATHLTGSKVCQVAITTVRWDFPGQRGNQPRRPRGGGRLEMRYNQPTIRIFFDVRDGGCTDLQPFLAANGFLGAFQNPDPNARKLQILPAELYQPIGDSVRAWETNPFGAIRGFPRR